MKHTYKITFIKKRTNVKEYEWQEIQSSLLCRLIITYCENNNIRVKQLKVLDACFDSLLKIKCEKADYLKLIKELSKGLYEINLKELKM